METVIGVFDQVYVERALKMLYDHGFDKSQLTLVDQEHVEEGPVAQEAGAVGTEIAPVAAVNPNAAVAPQVTAGMLGLDSAVSAVSDAIDFYRNAIKHGATVLILRTSAERANEARLLMRRAAASHSNKTPKTATRRYRLTPHGGPFGTYSPSRTP